MIKYSEYEQDSSEYFDLIKPPTRVFSDDTGNIRIEGQKEMKELGEIKPQAQETSKELVEMPVELREKMKGILREE